jgi:hypothetical protein
MQKVKIFLASSSELEKDRNGFEIFINRKNKELFDKNIFLELIIWEDFLDAVSKTRLQDEYNKAIAGCDIFLMLFFTKVGKYTEEEFENAFNEFKSSNKPFIFTYFKDAPVLTSEISDDIISLLQFKKKLLSLGHFCSTYKNIDELLFKFNAQLKKLEDASFLNFAPAAGEVKTVVKVNQTHSGSGDNVAGDKIVQK